MTDELVDWCDVAAVGVIAAARADIAADRTPVQWVLDECAFDLEVRHDVQSTAAALRDAYLAGKSDQPQAIRDAYASGVEAGRREATR